MGDGAQHALSVVVSGPRMRGLGRDIAVACPLRVDPSNPLQALLVGAVVNVREAYGILRRLGLPNPGLRKKLPWLSEALREPSRVMLSSGLSRVATAAESGVLYTTVRRRPKQRLWILPTPPGLGSVVMANVLLIYVLLTFRV